MRAAVEQFVAQWGLHIELIALKDIQLPAQMQEVIARKAIAERDRQYVIIKSQADVESAKNFAEAARILADSPGAMELRRLEALQNLSSQGTSKVIFDLAKPYADVHGAAGIAAAMAGRRGSATCESPSRARRGWRRRGRTSRRSGHGVRAQVSPTPDERVEPRGAATRGARGAGRVRRCTGEDALAAG